MDLTAVVTKVYESEINCSISSFWDNGFLVRLGDDMNGFLAEAEVRTPGEAAAFLDKAAREHFPESAYTLGHEQHEQEMRQRRKIHPVE
jgi:hypothetical protein